MRLNKQRKPRKRAKQIRHTHATAAGLEDVAAVLIDIKFGLDELTIRTSQALSILQDVRAGPHAYDKDRPAGLRVIIRRR